MNITDEHGNELQPCHTAPTTPYIKNRRAAEVQTTGGYISPLQEGKRVEVKVYHLPEGTYTYSDASGKQKVIVEGGQAMLYTYGGYMPATFAQPKKAAKKAGWVKGEFLPLEA